MNSRHLVSFVTQDRQDVIKTTINFTNCSADIYFGRLIFIVNIKPMQNAAARLIYDLRRSDHVTEALTGLPWLRIPERIVYKIAVLTYKVLHGSAPGYLGSVVRVADLPGRQALRSAGTMQPLGGATPQAVYNQ